MHSIFVIVHVTSSMNMIMSSVMVCHGGVLFQMQSSVADSHVISWHPTYSYAIHVNCLIMYGCHIRIFIDDVYVYFNELVKRKESSLAVL